MLFNREYDFTYGAGNRLLSYACDHVRLTYDDDGNVTGKITPEGTTQYQWDSENRLIGITKPDGTVIAYQYDELGRRVSKTVAGPSGSGQSRWAYLGEDIHRVGSVGAPTYVHGPGIDEPLGFGGSQYFIADGLGSIRQIVDRNGGVLNAYRYTAFGKIKQMQAAIGNAYTYTGREWDADAGVYYYRARWYDPEVGRFMSEDPIGFAGGEVDLYGYCLNDPVNSVDPDGEIAPVIAAYVCLAAIAAGFVNWAYWALHPQAPDSVGECPREPQIAGYPRPGFEGGPPRNPRLPVTQR